MPARRRFLQTASVWGLGWLLPNKVLPATRGIEPALADDRSAWYQLLYKIAYPVLEPMSRDRLKATMSLEVSPTWDNRNKQVAYMEAFGRLFAGVAPWLSLPEDQTSEGKLRAELTQQVLRSHTHAVRPQSNDYFVWHKEGQPLVDAAFVAHGFMRAKKQIWDPLDAVTRKAYVEHFQSLRRVKTPYNNWLLFSAIIECFLFSIGEQYDPFRIDLALRKHEEWYVGDGWFKDGPVFHFDYYNAYVIHPMLLDVLDTLRVQQKGTEAVYQTELTRMQRFAEQLERLISPEGSFPAFGRSVTYRLGAFQPLSQLALINKLPTSLTPGQVRAAMSAVRQRMFSVAGNFDDKGYLTLGFAGHQPGIADSYSNTGSMYLTSLGFLHLGLPASHTFWTSPAEEWTAKKAWSGQAFLKDQAMKEG